MAEYGDIMETQSDIMQAMEKLLTNFKKEPLERRTPSNTKRRLETLEGYWTEFQMNHRQLEQLEDKLAYQYFNENYYQQTIKFYSETKKYIETYLETQSDMEKIVHEPSTSKGTGENKQKAAKFTVNQVEEEPMPLANSNPSEMKRLLRKQEANFMAFRRTIGLIDVESITEKWEFEDALKSLQSRWSVVDNLHWEIIAESEERSVSYETKFNLYEKQFNDMKKTINSKMWSVAHRENATPKLDVPSFSGNYNQWVPFKDLFTEAIDKNNSLSNAQKMQFLKSKVRGEAEKLIQHLQISSENYSTCWSILQNRYNNRKMIFTTQINTLLGFPNMQQQSGGQIKKIHDIILETLNAIKNLGIDISTWDPLLIHLLSQKLDSETHGNYLESVKNPRELPSLKEFLDFLEAKFIALESSRRKQERIIPPRSANVNRDSQYKPVFNQNYNRGYFKESFGNSSHNNNIQRNQPPVKSFHISSNFKCPLCNQDHGIYNCKSFLEMPNEQKLRTVNKLKICINCLFSHNGNACISTRSCRKCNGQHSTILHDAIRPTETAQPKVMITKKQNDSTNSNSHVSQNGESEILLATAMLQVRAVDGTYLQLRALIDQGSQISLITENAAQLLGLKRQGCKGTIFGVGQKENACKGMINIECTSQYNGFTFTAEVLIMNNLIKNLPNNTFNKPSWNFLSDLNLADPEFYKSRPVDILFGADIYSNIILSGIIKMPDPTLPIAQQTQLGWLLCGHAKTITYHCNVALNNITEIERFWNIEEITEASNLSVEDQDCIAYYSSTTLRREDGRYEVRLPLKPNIQQKLGSSKERSIAQFRNLEKKFEKQEQLAKDYRTFMKEYKTLKHMALDNNSSTSLECYLPHHGVQREESSTTKYRVVFHASSKTTSGLSLNDVMYSGPNLQQDLQALLIKWRQYEFAFTADIEKMYRQILVNPQDQDLQKIVWRDSPQEPLKTYKLLTVTYGTKAAPFLALMTLRRLAADERENFAEAAKTVETSFYMDDLVHGSYSIEEGKQQILDLISLLKRGGMNLRKWSANDKELLQHIKQEENSNENKMFDFNTEETSKTLGLSWNSSTDMFTFNYKESKQNIKPTKRNLLSEISRLFDPLGWLAPLSTKLKLLFQKLWKLDLTWDDLVPDDIHKEWLKIKQSIPVIREIKIPRWLLCKANDTIILHGFCDASEKAYACVVYAQIKDATKVILVAAKSKLVPHKKVLSLPKLELSGALLLSKLIHKIKSSLHERQIALYCWTDSTAALGWIQGEPSRWKTFVANRVEKIASVIPIRCWGYVKSSDNPADIASRGIYASQLKDNVLWWEGPSWLSERNLDALKDIKKYSTDLETRTKNIKQTNIIQTESEEDNVIYKIMQKYNSITKIIRIIAWLQRTLNPQRKQLPAQLTLHELNKAKLTIIKYVQKNEFGSEMQQLNKTGIVKSNSKILSLNPIIHKDNILRVGGRLNHSSSISLEMKHPAIIPPSSRLAMLLINQAHLETFHGGPRLTLAKLRQQYWITGGVNIVKKVIRECVTCQKQNSTKLNQLMGDLPEARVNPAPPFYHTGVDYTGYMDVKMNKGRGARTLKAYVAVFVCMVTKAVHLEMVSELTSSAFIAALRRMAARRGAPAHIYSDNGTNFHGANNMLQAEYFNLRSIFKDSFFKEITEMQIQWHFTAPSWPSSGGLWERAVRSLKHHLRRVVGEQKLTFEEFSTILTQLEACLNSRPLCALTEDIEDLNILTPAHFLSGRADVTVIETAEDARTRWHLTTKIFQEIWKKWKFEYLSQLTARRKWLKPQQNIEIGDMVTIHEDNLPAGKWALGRVTETHPGSDGYVRVVTLRTKNGYIKRPVTKLSILPVRSSQEVNKTSELHSPDEQEKREPKIKRNTFSTIILTLIYFISLLSNVVGTSVITELDQNKTLYFDSITKMQLNRDSWTMVVYYDMNPFWEGNTALEKISNYLTTTCAELHQDNQCNMITSQLNHHYLELQYYNQLLLNQHFKFHSRQRRGLINGVGYIANALFGVLDDQFAEQYTKDIQLLRASQSHLNNLWKNQTSLIESEYNLLKRTEAIMSKQHKIINKHLVKIDSALSTLEKQVNKVSLEEDFSLSALAAQQLLQTLKEIQQTLLDTVTDIYHGHFNIHLLTPKQLQEELNTISALLSSEVTLPINNIESDVREIYKLLKIKARMTKEYFIFEIKIPLISRDTYDLYRLIPIPQRVGNYMRNIIPIAKQIAINLQKDSYIPINQEDIQNCMAKDSSTWICALNSPVYKLKKDQDLCIKNEPDLYHCKTETVACQSEWHSLTKVNTYLYTCCGQCQIRTICKDRVTAHQLTNPSVININGQCLIKTDNFTVFAHKDQRNTINIKENLDINVIAPINQIINLNMEQITLPGGNENEDLSNDPAHKEIEKRIQGLKDAEAIDLSSLSHHDIHQYTVLYGIIVVGAVSAGLYVCRRRRRARRPGAAASPAQGAAPAPGAQATPPRVRRAAARSTSMSQLYQVSECDSESAGVRKVHSETELKVLKPVSVARKLVFSE